MTLTFYLTPTGFKNLHDALVAQDDWKAPAAIVNGEKFYHGLAALDIDTEERSGRLGCCEMWSHFTGWRYIEEEPWLGQRHKRIELLNQGTTAIIYPTGGDERCP